MKALAEIYTMHSFAQLLESIIENWGKKNLAKITPKNGKREAIKQLAARYLELQRKGAAKKIAGITKEYAEDIWAPFVE